MPFHIVQPYTDKPDRLLTAIRVRSLDTAAEAFAELDRIGERLHGFDIPGDAIEMLVVDEERRPRQAVKSELNSSRLETRWPTT